MTVQSSHSEVILVARHELSQCARHGQRQSLHISNFLPERGVRGLVLILLVSVELIRADDGVDPNTVSQVPGENDTIAASVYLERGFARDHLPARLGGPGWSGRQRSRVLCWHLDTIPDDQCSSGHHWSGDGGSPLDWSHWSWCLPDRIQWFGFIFITQINNINHIFLAAVVSCCVVGFVVGDADLTC